MQSINDGVLLEFGQFPLLILAKKRAIKNWARMATNKHCNKIVYDSYQCSTDENLQWTENMKTMLSEIGLMQSFVTKDPDTHSKAFQRLRDIYLQTALEKIKSEDSKLRTYALFKTTPGFEKYIDEVSCIKVRTAFTKFRICNHKLMIEKGRHLSINKSLCFCPFCPNRIEDEKHFLIKCQTYKYLRSGLYDETKTIFPSICNQTQDYRILTLMRDVTTASVSRFVFRAMELREFLLSKRKIHD